jgi:putative salt-induced outer membrane protein YdiY
MQTTPGIRTSTLLLCGPLLVALSASAARAQEIAASEAHSEAAKLTEPFQADVTTLNASLGAALNTGNTEAWQLNTGSQFDLVRGRHGFSLMMAFAYGRANVPDDTVDALVDTVRNLRTRARYDFFLTPMDALFLAAVYRWDTFAGLDMRAQGQVGYMRNFIKEEKQRFWGEAGYDLTYDNYDPDPLPNPDVTGAFLDGDDVVHSARFFLGYDNQISATLTYLTGVEALVNVEELEDVRFTWDNALRSSIGGGFDLELKLTIGLDTQPVPGAEKVDTATIVNLIYTLQ